MEKTFWVVRRKGGGFFSGSQTAAEGIEGLFAANRLDNREQVERLAQEEIASTRRAPSIEIVRFRVTAEEEFSALWAR